MHGKRCKAGPTGKSPGEDSERVFDEPDQRSGRAAETDRLGPVEAVALNIEVLSGLVGDEMDRRTGVEERDVEKR